MSCAQLGLYFPGAGQQEGWAWAGTGDAVEANAVDQFVRNALLRIQQQEPSGGALDDGNTEQVGAYFVVRYHVCSVCRWPLDGDHA